MTIRIVVTLDQHGDITVLSNTPGVQVLVIDRDVEGAQALVSVQAQPAAVDSVLQGLPVVDAQRVEAIFDEVGPQLPAARTSPEFAHQQRTQLRLLAKNWFANC